MSYHNYSKLALGQVGQLDFLDSDRLTRTPIEGTIYGPEGALAQAISELLPLNVSLRLSYSSAIEWPYEIFKAFMFGLRGPYDLILLLRR